VPRPLCDDVAKKVHIIDVVVGVFCDRSTLNPLSRWWNALFHGYAQTRLRASLRAWRGILRGQLVAARGSSNLRFLPDHWRARADSPPHTSHEFAGNGVNFPYFGVWGCTAHCQIHQ
jgi:hypothetical protein